MSSDKRGSTVFSWNKTAANETKWYQCKEQGKKWTVKGWLQLVIGLV